MIDTKTIGENYENLPSILAPYMDDIDQAKDRLRLKGKTIGEANKEQGSWLLHYDARRKELEVLHKYMEAQVAKVRGQLFRKFTENFSIDLSDRAKDKYIDKEPEYLKVYEVMLTVEEITEAFKSIVDAFIQRGYSLKNLTELRINALDESML